MEIILSGYTAEQAAQLSSDLQKYIDELDGVLRPRLVHTAAVWSVFALPVFLIPGMIAHIAGNRLPALVLFTLAFGAFVFSAVSFLFDIVSMNLSLRKYPERFEFYIRLIGERQRIEEMTRLLFFGDVFRQIEDEARGEGDKASTLHKPAQKMLALLKSGQKIRGIDLRATGMGRRSELASMVIHEEGRWDFSFLDEKLETWMDHVNSLCVAAPRIEGIRKLILERPVKTRPVHRVVIEVEQSSGNP